MTRPSRREVTMAAIARQAGVSVTTVSHVINRTRRVSPQTERAVLVAVADLGYVPDGVARSQRTAVGSMTIGLAMSAISNIYFGDVVHSIEQAASAAGYSLILTDTHDEVAGELRAVSDLLTRRVAAVILAPSRNPSRAMAFAQRQQVPVIVIDRHVDEEVDQVAVENIEPTATLVDHLASLGHTGIAMISGRAGLTTSAEREAGFLSGLERNGLAMRRPKSGGSSSEGAYEAFVQLMSGRKPPTALVVGNNTMTIGAMRAARDLKIDVPRELALVSFDDFEWADLFHPRLTAIAQPIAEEGSHAVNLTLTRLLDQTMPPRRITLKPSFVHRESCGCTAS